MKGRRRGSTPMEPICTVTVCRRRWPNCRPETASQTCADGLPPFTVTRRRLLTQPITLLRDLHCIRAGEVYFDVPRPTGRLPIPRHPVVRSDKPELRQQLTDPKRRISLGSFFLRSPPGFAGSVRRPLTPRQVFKHACGNSQL